MWIPLFEKDENVKFGLKSRGCYNVNGYQVKANLDGCKSKFLEWWL